MFELLISINVRNRYVPTKAIYREELRCRRIEDNSAKNKQ
jgi:hypothetical protein